MQWATAISKKAMEIAFDYEINKGWTPEYVHQKGVGYDILSIKDKKRKHIEVKGVSESWATYSWQPLHHTEVSELQNNPTNFFLYIIYFDIGNNKRDNFEFNKYKYTFYVISGKELKQNFTIKAMSYSLSPISKSKLNKYKESQILN